MTQPDDGFSGTNFERPQIQKLLNEVRLGKIECIVVKDFSRFGRNYIEVGDYLEQVFPFLGIRFISVNDNYDSNRNNGTTSSMDVAFKNIMNDFYSKDLSKKIKSSKVLKMKKGEFLASTAPYGYAKVKNHLVIDAESSNVVKRIFEMYLDDVKLIQIARILNDEGILTPYLYKKKRFDRANGNIVGEKNYWTSDTLRRILIDEHYIGKMINNKHNCLIVGNKKVVAVPKSEWIVVDNQQEPIIAEEDFKRVQNKMRKIKSKEGGEKDVKLLSGKVRCGYCKRLLLRTGKKEYKYSCKTSLLVSDVECMRGGIREKDVEDVVLSSIQNYVNVTLDKEEKLIKLKKNNNYSYNNSIKKLKGLQIQIERIKSLKAENYELYRDEKISREEYFVKRDCVDRKVEDIQNRINNIELEMKKVVKEEDFVENNIEIVKKYGGLNKLTRQMIEEFINVIYVYNQKQIEIVWEHKDFCDVLKM